MRKLLGLILAAFGLVFGHAAYQNAPTHREDQLAEVTRILTNPGVETAASAGVPARAPLLPSLTSAPAATGKSRAAEPVTGPVAVAVAEPPIAPTAATPKSTTWQTSVAAEAARPGTTKAVTSALPGDPSARRVLVRSLQTELKRVGCFSGEVSGNWSAKSKRALAQFIERVNASLPVEEPDYIQLTLLQGQAGTICGRDCPKGQAQSTDGRCVPSAILAQAERQPEIKSLPAQADAAAWSTNTRLDAPQAAGQRVEIARAEPESELPWTRQTPGQTPNQPHRRVDQLAGRMSIGGPAQAGGTRTPPDRVANLEDPATGDPETMGPAAEGADGDRVRSADRSGQQVAALTEAPFDDASRMAVPLATPPKARLAVPKAYFGRPQKAASKSQKVKGTGYRPQRSVQSLFTHPLGRM